LGGFKSAAAPHCATLFLIFAFAFFFSGCRQDMHNQPRYEPLEQSSFFSDGRASRQLVAGTVPRGVSREILLQATGGVVTGGAPPSNQPAAPQGQIAQPAAGQPANNQSGNNQEGNRIAPGALPAGLNDFPTPVTAEMLARGQEQFNISCSPCHGMLGYGDGMVVQRGFPRPPSYHTARLQTAPNSHFYNVITNGFGRMWNYADQVEPDTRWAVIAYIRALQISQNAKLDEVPQDQRKYLEKGGQTR
jgi:mono/diheme cytochrome c family protein